MRIKGLVAALLLFTGAWQPAAAQQGDQNGLIGQTTAAPAIDDSSVARRGGSLLADQRAGRRAPPFGSELFAGAPPTAGGPILDPAYVLKPGDTVAVNQWGLVNSNAQLTVDPSGNIVVPGVGPVPVAGVAAGALDQRVKDAANATYRTGGVQTYAAPLSATTLQVFVTGPVVKPGVYAGSSSDSIVGFLQRAGGPDPNRGSYRHVFVKRGNRVVAEADLYAFITAGTLPDVRLQQGDVIVVGEQGSVVTVTGDARAAYTFELVAARADGGEVLRYARPRPEVTDVTLLSVANGNPVNAVMPLAEFARRPLGDGDRVQFEAYGRADTVLVRAEGAVRGVTSFVVPRGTRLGTVLARLQMDSLADTAMIHLRRVSAAETQKQLLDESLARLEKAIYTTPSQTSSVAEARRVDSAGLAQFIARARTVQPAGLVALREVDPNQVLIEPDDVIVVPFQSQAVVVGGEVALPQSLIADTTRDARDYVARTGGFTERANRGQVLVISPDGTARIGGGVRPGDRVLVPPKITDATFSLVRDITTILYQLGIAAVAVFR
jgi:protein involved in polysaccharide export with SLBB domain